MLGNYRVDYRDVCAGIFSVYCPIAISPIMFNFGMLKGGPEKEYVPHSSKEIIILQCGFAFGGRGASHCLLNMTFRIS